MIKLKENIEGTHAVEEIEYNNVVEREKALTLRIQRVCNEISCRLEHGVNGLAGQHLEAIRDMLTKKDE